MLLHLWSVFTWGTAAILVFQNNETAAMLVNQTNPVGVERFSYVKTFVSINLHVCWPREWKRSIFMVHGCELNIAFYLPVFLVSRAPEERDLITVPYLNPLVLRKELENMFENDGITTLQFPEVVQEKSIIFWNLVSEETWNMPWRWHYL